MPTREQPLQSAHLSWRSCCVGLAMGADICINYPLWVAAKRLGVGLSAFPGSLPEATASFSVVEIKRLLGDCTTTAPSSNVFDPLS